MGVVIITFNLSTGKFNGLKKDIRRHNMTYNSSTIRKFDSLGYNAPLPMHIWGKYCVHAVKTPTNILSQCNLHRKLPLVIFCNQNRWVCRLSIQIFILEIIQKTLLWPQPIETEKAFSYRANKREPSMCTSLIILGKSATSLRHVQIEDKCCIRSLTRLNYETYLW